jgi:CRISPR/Cas system-associated endoribonuclease Cas2
MAFDITDESIKKIRKYASRGLTRRQIAASMGWSHTTLYNKLKKNVAIVDAIKEGEASGIKKVANALFKTALDGNVTSMIFYLKNRAPNEWKDRLPEGTPPDAPQPTRIEIVTVDARKTD